MPTNSFKVTSNTQVWNSEDQAYDKVPQFEGGFATKRAAWNKTQELLAAGATIVSVVFQTENVVTRATFFGRGSSNYVGSEGLEGTLKPRIYKRCAVTGHALSLA